MESIAKTHGVDNAAFAKAAAQLDALRKINVQAEHIDELRKKFAREEKRELFHLESLRLEAEKLGAYNLIAPAARTIAAPAVRGVAL